MIRMMRTSNTTLKMTMGATESFKTTVMMRRQFHLALSFPSLPQTPQTLHRQPIQPGAEVLEKLEAVFQPGLWTITVTPVNGSKPR
jgi:hypothetical protein